jgi:hypothetical protein
MTSAAIINEIRGLPPEEQARVIQFTVGLAQNRQLTGKELGELAQRLAVSNDPAEIIRLKSVMRQGFYGKNS